MEIFRSCDENERKYLILVRVKNSEFKQFVLSFMGQNRIRALITSSILHLFDITCKTLLFQVITSLPPKR